MKRTLQDYKSDIKPVWCPGCGDYGILTALQKALLALDLPPEDIMTISGIGCSGRFSHYMNTYSMHGTHGRAIPTAVGAKAARPESTVIVVGGDGDGLGIGGGHIVHAARKNVNLTYILIDNQIYGLTKGQSSPTTPIGTRTKTTPKGAYESTLDVIPMFLAYDVSFIARTVSTKMAETTELLKQAIMHKGMSIVYVLSQCVTFPVFKSTDLKEMFEKIPESHDKTDKMAAMQLAYSQEPAYSGIFYQIEKPTLDERLHSNIEKACMDNNGQPYKFEDILSSFH